MVAPTVVKISDKAPRAGLAEIPENPSDPPHFSPTEHIAKAGDCDVELSGNFHTDDFIQYRKVLELGIENEVIIYLFSIKFGMDF